MMSIGIDASRAFLPERTGIEEYSYQVIKHLRDSLGEESVFLYIRSGQTIDFALPRSWRVKRLWSPRLWTQFRLSLEMSFHPVDVLFVPAHTVPIIHPARNATLIGNIVTLIIQKIIHPFTACMAEHSVAGGPRKTIVTVHGLEYEFCPQAYSFLERWYMWLSIRYSVRVASTVIAVSENTRKDLMSLYGVAKEKITVISEGYERNIKYQISNIKKNKKIKNLQSKPYLLFIGRLEERKNVKRIIEAFAILKEKYRIPHRLVLAGKRGYGYERIKNQESRIKNKNDIVELGYVSEEEKWELLNQADVFVFPSLYEGFGIPILEAQSVGTPVLTSSTSSLPEVGGEGAVSVDPLCAESIAEGVWEVLSDAKLRDGIIEKGSRNVGRFSWERCAEEVATTFSKRNERK